MNFDFRSRFKRLRRLMEQKGLDAVIITDPHDIFYYSGYRVQTDERPFLITDGTDSWIGLSPLTGNVRVFADVFFVKRMGDVAKRLKGFDCIGFDEYSMTFYFHNFFRKKKVSLKPFSIMIKKPREVKDDLEIELIRKAIKTDKKALENFDWPGKTEIQAAKSVDEIIFDSQAENAFETIVSSGRNAGNFIHHFPSGKVIAKRDLVIVDFGARVNGYCSDITRTFCSRPGGKERNMFETVKDIQGKILDFIIPGMKFKAVNDFYMKLMRKKRFRVLHGIGHGIGLFVHEPCDVLQKGCVITIEPGIYMKNFGGCRIEDMILIKKNGIKILSGSVPKEL